MAQPYPYYNADQVTSFLNELKTGQNFTFQTGSVDNHTAMYAPINDPKISQYFKDHPQILGGKFTVGKVDGHDVLMVSELDGDKPIGHKDAQELIGQLGRIEDALDTAGIHNSYPRGITRSVVAGAANGIIGNMPPGGHIAHEIESRQNVASVAPITKTGNILG